MIASKENKGVICSHCEKQINGQGVLVCGKLYHDKCGDKVSLKVGSIYIEEPKKIYIAV